MPPKADTAASQAPPPAAGVSGKWLVMGIFGLALAAAAGSWWFRYSSTHKAAEFWGPDAARLIRDAPHVEFLQLAPPTLVQTGHETISVLGETYQLVARRDVSSARGMAHLRNALLLDRSFDGFNLMVERMNHGWRWALAFRSGDATATVLLAGDCAMTRLAEVNGQTADCRPIAEGLLEMFAEFEAQPMIQPPLPAR